MHCCMYNVTLPSPLTGESLDKYLQPFDVPNIEKLNMRLPEDGTDMQDISINLHMSPCKVPIILVIF